ncbi:hypothetical protein F511_04101 [Dorcoceras hygrometricum]|uniref:Uncharacterized protein n=1 Tax=Dorcoceras hygrometricum TaxID=472368 RepID=A0A2Z7D557_9LAMI|nr:hypothetical protein F511_04101 [Dorcoceras hygrometricum]
MSLFDLQDVCMVIGSLATLDLPMVVDLIGIFVLKGPYCTLTMTNWFLQSLSVIPRGSWGDVARRFTMIRWGQHCYFGLGDRSDLIIDRDYDGATVMDLKRMCTLGLGPRPPAHRKSIYRGLRVALTGHSKNPRARLPPFSHSSRPPPLLAVVCRCRRTCSARLDEEIPSVKYSSCFLVQTDEGIEISVVDRIRRTTTAYRVPLADAPPGPAAKPENHIHNQNSPKGKGSKAQYEEQRNTTIRYSNVTCRAMHELYNQHRYQPEAERTVNINCDTSPDFVCYPIASNGK